MSKMRRRFDNRGFRESPARRFKPRQARALFHLYRAIYKSAAPEAGINVARRVGHKRRHNGGMRFEPATQGYLQAHPRAAGTLFSKWDR
jgi:hypothetical protein